MKKLALVLLAAAASAFGANVQIRDLSTTIVLPSSNTFIIADGATQGTVKAALANYPLVTNTRTTLAGLSVSGISTGVTVQTLGGSAVADGSASLYYYNSASTATPNGTTVIQPTVGSGRWLIISQSGLPTPTTSTLGGVFSKAAVTNQFLTSLGTDGTFTSAQPSIGQISGAGNMAVQNSSAVTITGGSISGVAITSTSFANDGSITVGTGSAASTRSVIINGGSNTNTGSTVDFQRGSSTVHRIGVDGPITGSGTGDLAIFAGLSQSVKFYANGSFTSVGQVSSSGLNGMAIGVNTPAAASFTNLTANGFVNMSNTFQVSGAANTPGSGLGVELRGGSVPSLTSYNRSATSYLTMDYDASSHAFKSSGSTVGSFTSTGLNGTVIGATTPAAATFTTISSNSNANLRTTKGNLNLVINIKDYGAVGDGVTNDTAAIAAAVAALPSSGARLIIPPGTFITDVITITGKTGLSVLGDGIGVSVLKGRTGNQVLNISSSTEVAVSGITFNGNCTARTAGQQAVIFSGHRIQFTNNEVLKAGEYAVMFGPTVSTTDVICSNNIIRDTYADGINLQNVQGFVVDGNIVDGADDDCIAVGYNGTGTASGGVISNNFCRSRNDLGTTWGRGIAIIGALDVQVIGNYISGTKQTGLYVAKEAGGYVGRCSFIGNTVFGAAIHSGHAAVLYGTRDCAFIDNYLLSPVQGNLLELANWEHLTIQGGVFTSQTNAFVRGIHVDEGTGWPDATWYNLIISDVTIRLEGAASNSCIYLSPNSAYTMQTGVISGVNGKQFNAGDYITLNTARCANLWKVVNNTTLRAGSTITPSSSSGIFTVVNNN